MACCPQCEREVSSGVLRRRVAGILSVASNAGLVCDHCGAHLRIHPSRYVGLILIAWALAFLLLMIIEPGPVSHVSPWQLLAVLPLILAYGFGPRLVSFSLAPPEDQLNYSASAIDNEETRFEHRQRPPWTPSGP